MESYSFRREINIYNFDDKSLAMGTYSYRIKQIDFEGSFKFYYLSKEVVMKSPTEFLLSQNYPNPFNPETKIHFMIPQSSYINLTIYNSLGQEVQQLYDGIKEVGSYDLSFSAKDLPSGLYFYTLRVKESESNKEFSETKKMILLR